MTANPDDKRVKGNETNEINDIAHSPLNMEPGEAEKELTLADIKRYMDSIIAQVKYNGKSINTLATKKDFSEMNDQMVAQGAEINQLRTELKSLEKTVKDIESNLDLHIAQKLDRMSRSADPQTGRERPNMASRNQNNTFSASTKRRNLVFEGLRGLDDDEIKVNIIKIAEAINVSLFASEIEMVTRIKRRDDNDPRPGPVIATFTWVVLRDAIITKKSALQNMEGFAQVYVNADEPLQVRRSKAILRKAAYIARNEGCEVEMRYDRIRINNDLYTVETAYTLPKKYLVSNESARGAEGGHDPPNIPVTDMDAEPTAPKMDRHAKFVIKPGENMRLSKKGLLFSGPSAFISNLSYYPIRFEERDYNSNEQVYQWTKANRHDQPEIAAEIKRCTEAFDILYAGAEIVTTSEWNKNAPLLLATLFHLKMERHPELLQRLISTSPHRLIEASTSKKWGGGAPISSDVYDSDKPLPGSNGMGDIATNYRDKKISELFPDEV